MILRFLAFVALFFASDFSYSQIYKRSQIEELSLSLDKQEGRERINTLLKLSKAYNYFHLDSALGYCNLAAYESQKLDYSWGYYKSLYYHISIKLHTNPIHTIEEDLNRCTDWFYENHYEADALYCELIRTRVLSQTIGAEEGKTNAELTLERARAHDDPLLLGMAWHVVEEFRLHIVKDGAIPHSLDSADYYYQMVGDSARILKSKLDQYSSTLNDAFYVLENAKRWGNVKLMSDACWFAGVGFILRHQPRAPVDSAIYYLEKSIDYAEIYGKSEFLKESAYFIMGHAYLRYNQISDALYYFQMSDTLNQKFEFQRNRCDRLREIGNCHFKMGEYDKAAVKLIECVQLSEEFDQEYSLHTAKMMLGDLYRITEDYEKAEEIYKQEIHWADSTLPNLNKARKKAQLYRKLATVRREQGEFEQAIMYYDSSAFEGRGNELTDEYVETKLNMISLYLDQGDLQTARIESIDLKQQKERPFIEKNPLFFKVEGELLIHEGEYLAGSKALQTYIAQFPKNHVSSDLQEAYFDLYTAYDQIEKHERALDSFLAYQRIKDSLTTNKVEDNVAKIQADYEVSLKEAEIKTLKQRDALVTSKLNEKNTQLELRKSYITLLVILLLLISIVAYFFFRRIKHTRENEALLMKSRRIALELENIQSKRKAELAEVKNTIFANISHEFRTPLTLIQVPIKNFLTRANEGDKQVFNGVLNNTEDLLRMVDELLDLAKIETGAVELNKSIFNIQDFFVQVKAGFSPLFQQKGIHFQAENNCGKMKFEADENRVKIVINNLLKNAFLHTPSGGTVRWSIRHFGDSLNMEVANTGKPIPTKDLPHLFDRHFRGGTENYVGNGIGLSLSHQIVALHKGDIAVKNDGTKGVIFTVKFPGKTLSDQTRFHGPVNTDDKTLYFKANEADQMTKFNVLVVEDNEEMRQLLNSVLSTDFNLTFAPNGEKGEKMALENQPDLILSDVMMPKKDGFELLNAIKSNITTSHIPIILLTAKADKDSKILGLQQNADDYIGKPFDPTELKVRLHNLLRQREKLRTLFSNNPLLQTSDIKFTPLDTAFLNKVRHILEENYSDGDFTITDFCGELALNRNSVHNKIKAFTSQTTAEYIKNFRLEKAVQMLVGSNASISNVYMDVGFNSPQAFNQAFKKRFDCTPTQYRKKHQ